MTLNVALHNVTKATLHEFPNSGELWSALTFTSREGGKLDLYLPPEVGRALVAAFNAATETELEAAE